MRGKIRLVLIESDKKRCAVIKSHLIGVKDMEPVGIAHDGLSGLKLIAEKMPDIVVMDTVLPILDGLGVMKKIKKMDLEKKPAVIIITSNPRASAAKLAFDGGAEYIILKPYKIENLIDRVRDIYNANLRVGYGRVIVENAYQSEAQKTPEFRIMTMLNCCGVSEKHAGYKFMTDALLLELESPNALRLITKRIYPDVAVKNNTTQSNVERSIRYAIEAAWNNTNGGIIKKANGTAGNCECKRPTNAKFLINIAQKLKIEEMIANYTTQLKQLTAPKAAN
ncbi:MAG: sporulation transcription factor Spo0A [Clostridiales bacterium]|nr:sporulation transcription factor Spo0A [Clostridiales bacterium]